MVEIQETSERSSYVSFLYYYKKNWLAYEQLWEEFDISNVAFVRTNNPAEKFNRRLNQLVIRANSKLSISLGGLRILPKKSKRAFVSSVSSPKKTKLTAEDHIQKIKKFCTIIDEFNRNKFLENLLGDYSELTDLEKLQEEMEEVFNRDDPDQDFQIILYDGINLYYYKFNIFINIKKILLNNILQIIPSINSSCLELFHILELN